MPNKRTFDLVMIMLLAWQPAKALVKLPLQRIAQDGNENGWRNIAARAGIGVLS